MCVSCHSSVNVGCSWVVILGVRCNRNSWRMTPPRSSSRESEPAGNTSTVECTHTSPPSICPSNSIFAVGFLPQIACFQSATPRPPGVRPAFLRRRSTSGWLRSRMVPIEFRPSQLWRRMFRARVASTPVVLFWESAPWEPANTLSPVAGRGRPGLDVAADIADVDG